MVREAVSNETQFTLLDVLFDGIEGLILADLPVSGMHSHLQLGICPSRHFHDHVQHRLVSIGKQGNIVEGRYHLPIFGLCRCQPMDTCPGRLCAQVSLQHQQCAF